MISRKNHKMAIKDIWTKTRSWLRSYSPARVYDSQPQLDDQGLITEDADSAELPAENHRAKNDGIVVKAVPPISKAESLEKLHGGFDKLIDKLQTINEHLNRQTTQNEELIGRIEQLPQLLERFPSFLENQKEMLQQLLEQFQVAAVKNQQFLEAVEKIPTEAAKHTDLLVEIDHQLSAAADVDVQMVESFEKFNEMLGKLNQSTRLQIDSINQINKTFATSDRYLKYIIARQNKRFMWLFIVAISICVAVVFVLAGIIIYLIR